MDNFSKSAITALKLILPRVGLVLNGATFFVRDAFSVLFAQIPRIVSENIPILMQSSVALVEALAYGLVDNHDLILNAFVSAFSVLSGGVEKLLPALYVFARESTILFNEVIGEIAPDIAVSFVRGIVNGFSAAYAGENVNRFYKSFGKLLSGLTQALVDSAPYFLSAGIEVATVFGQQALLNPEVLESLIKTGIEMIGIVAMGFVKAIPIIGGAAMKAVANIASRFVNYDWMGLLRDIGVSIIYGLTVGIDDAWGDLEKQLNRLLDSLVDKAKKILGIASPSKVFKKLGSFTAEGFGIGFEDEFAHVKDDMEDALNFDDASVGINASIRKVGAGAAGAAYGGTSIGNITINIDGAKYNDEQSLASAIALEIQYMTDRRAAVNA